VTLCSSSSPWGCGRRLPHPRAWGRLGGGRACGDELQGANQYPGCGVCHPHCLNTLSFFEDFSLFSIGALSFPSRLCVLVSIVCCSNYWRSSNHCLLFELLAQRAYMRAACCTVTSCLPFMTSIPDAGGARCDPGRLRGRAR
jgi:hypothetical protein